MSDKLDVSRIVEMLGQGLTEGNIAYELGVSPWAVRVALREARHERTSKPQPRASKWDPADDAELTELLKTRSLRQVADHFGRSMSSVHRRAVRLGIERRTVSEGVRLSLANGHHKRAKLNPSKVVELRAMDRKGASDSVKAKAFGISRITARAAADGETWGHVPVLVCANIGGTNAQ